MDKFWKINNVADDIGELRIYGDILSSKNYMAFYEDGAFAVTPEGFADDLKTLGDKKSITVRINSSGGDACTGIAIHNALKSLPQTVNVIVDGLAASAASIIMCAGDTVSAYPGSLVMIHSAKVAIMDWMDEADLQAALNAVGGTNRAIAKIYAERTGLSETVLKNMMTAETWMTGSEAVDKGFADGLLGGDCEKKYDASNKLLMVAGVGFDLSKYTNTPFRHKENETMNMNEMVNKIVDGVKDAFRPDEVTETAPEETETEELESIKTQDKIDKEILAKATEDAIRAERARLKGIEEIEASVSDKRLLAEAKYGDSAMTAEELALAAMKAEAKVNKAMSAAIKADAANSGVNKVEAAQEPTPQAMDEKMIAAARKIFGSKSDKAGEEK